jgi:acetyl/propionyl-CoA carboxylase alpha subunit
MIANRGEVARRVISTASRMGIRTIAAHSEAETHLPYLGEADQAVHLGPAPSASSYLDAEAVVAVAPGHRAEAGRVRQRAVRYAGGHGCDDEHDGGAALAPIAGR